MFLNVVKGSEVRRLEKLALLEGSSEDLFMQTAAENIADSVVDFLKKNIASKTVYLIVGKGNKGGDCLLAGLFLLKKKIKVTAFCLFPEKDSSKLNQKYRKLFSKKGSCIECKNPQDLNFAENAVILDGLLGTGFQGDVKGDLAVAIAMMNASKLPIISIDVPSGLDCDTGVVKTVCVRANITVTLGFYKRGFYLEDGWNFIGEVVLKSFGLAAEIAKQAQVEAHILSEDIFPSLLPPIVRNRHKYQAGYVLGFSGSMKYPGAAKLAAMGALRSGAGIVRVMSFATIENPPLSVIFNPYSPAAWKKELLRAKALFIGPGVDNDKKTLSFMKKVLKNLEIPVVVDADAIQKSFSYPKGSLLTPHRGEALRLLGIKQATDEQLEKSLQKWVDKTFTVVVLKGGPTKIFSPQRPFIVMPYGDPGMAKAGVGDVLTGIIAGLVSQNMTSLDAAVLGVYIHAKSGQLAASCLSSYSMMAPDLIDKIGKVMKGLSKDAK